MAKPKFYYCHGTAALFGIDFDKKLSLLFSGQTEPQPGNKVLVSGINGYQKGWDLSVPADPFPDLLDGNLWSVERVPYPAASLGMGVSIDAGVASVISRINALPAGHPFALGGYSQGAAVMSSVLRELQTGSLTSRYSSLLGGVMFGNPRRKVNFRGPIGGTWSGAWDVPGSNSGGHGSFPTTGPWPRLTSPPDTWVEFAAPSDIFTAVGDSSIGLGWTAGNDVFLDLTKSQALTYFLTGMVGDMLSGAIQAIALAGVENSFTDAVGTPFTYGGNGHTVYPFLPPVAADGSAGSGETSYQLGIRYLNGLAGEWATAPIIVPQPAPVETGWQTTLVAAGSPTLSAGWSTTL